jgi:predicted nucleotide-binding protein
MAQTDRQSTALQTIADLRKQLVELTHAAQRSGDTDTGFESLRRWKDRACRRLDESVSKIESKKLAAKRKMSWAMGDPVGNLKDEAQMFEGFLVALKQEIEGHPEDVLDRPVADEQPQTERIEVPGPKGHAVFIVHGHDELNLYRLKDLVRERYALEAIVLANEPGQGRSLIEKFEDEAQRASFAFVLLTPDDLITKPDGTYSQARPNVIFELGWFYGRLTRKRVCILFKSGTKLHSDLDGISRIEFKENVSEKLAEIERELVAGGLLKAAKKGK